MKALKLFVPISLVLLLGFSPVQTWVAIGDSITYLNDHLDETGNRVSRGYMTIVKEKIPELEYINQGHNGWTAKRIAENIDKLNIQEADFYSILLGTNDWWRGIKAGSISDYKNATGTNTVAGSFKVIIDHLKAKSPKAKIILLTPMQRGDFVYFDNFNNNAHGSYKEKDGQSLEEIANLILEIASFEQLEVIDLYYHPKLNVKNAVKFKRLRDPDTGDYRDFAYPAYTKMAFEPKTDEYPYPIKAQNMTYDGLHPSDKGNELIAKLLVQKLKILN